MDGSEGTGAPFEYHVPNAQWRVYRRLSPPPLFTEGAAKAHFSWHFQAGGNAFEVNFYEDRFETRNSTSHGVHEYSKLFNVVESDSGIYLEIEQGHSVIIEKKNCSEELIAFLRKLEK
jgi:hypothetical protein